MYDRLLQKVNCYVKNIFNIFFAFKAHNILQYIWPH